MVVAGGIVAAAAVGAQPAGVVRESPAHEVKQALHGGLGLGHGTAYFGGVLLELAHAHGAGGGGIGQVDGGQPIGAKRLVKFRVEDLECGLVAEIMLVHRAHLLAHLGIGFMVVPKHGSCSFHGVNV
ncbi:MAG: hypothetical protein JWP58_2773 [Hymenobacter sp.]|nr:hypothetical protein [Hymenobacter sp.]